MFSFSFLYFFRFDNRAKVYYAQEGIIFGIQQKKTELKFELKVIIKKMKKEFFQHKIQFSYSLLPLWSDRDGERDRVREKEKKNYKKIQKKRLNRARPK